MKPKYITTEDWSKLLKKFKPLTLKTWYYLDGLKKLSLLRGAKIPINDQPLFLKDYRLKYPEDIYSYDTSKLFYLDPSTLNQIRRMAIYQDSEVGGTIEYDQGNTIDLKFSGTENRIELDYRSDTHTLFHTHPKDDRLYDPPSILDIISFLALTVKYIADLVIDIDRGIEHAADDPLVIQSSAVFTKDEVYIYYISRPLVVNIVRKLIELFLKNDDFVYQVEKLLEEMEIVYSAYLFPFNRDLDRIDEYLETLSSLGILIKRFKYTENPEVYISL